MKTFIDNGFKVALLASISMAGESTNAKSLPYGIYSADKAKKQCGDIRVEKKGEGYPGFQIVRQVLINDYEGDSTLTIKTYPFNQIGGVYSGSWDQRFVLETAEGCFQLVQEMLARDPSDYGFKENLTVCYQDHISTITMDFGGGSPTICSYKFFHR